MALTLQERGLARPDIERWLGTVVAEVSQADRTAVLKHMIETGVLADDGGVLGMGIRGEREFGRRHFSDLVAAFSSPLLLAVYHGATELGTVHPTSLARSADGGSTTLLLAGRSWRVMEVDWPRRRISVASAPAGGKSRWLGAGRSQSMQVCRSAERIVAGTEPYCALSRRAEAALGEIRERLAFVDGRALPIVFDNNGRVRVWCFAGGLASAALACALRLRGLAVADWDDFSISLHRPTPDEIATALASIKLSEARPELPDDLGKALKFSACLPDEVIRAVVETRLGDPAGVSAALSRPTKLVRVASELS